MVDCSFQLVFNSTIYKMNRTVPTLPFFIATYLSGNLRYHIHYEKVCVTLSFMEFNA